MKNIIPVILMIALNSCGDSSQPLQLPPEIQIQESGSTASFRGVAVKSALKAWVCGTGGTVLKTVDGGASWQKVDVPGADSLDFRDIELTGDQTILLMSIGNGDQSRIYKSTDDGHSWKTTYINAEPDAFFDGFDFWNDSKGILISDPIDDKLYLLKTTDGGETWSRVGQSTLPPLNTEEYGFAASGTGIATFGSQKVWIATGGAKARVFYSTDSGENWLVTETPMVSGKPSAGIFSIAFKDEQNGVAVGGDYQADSLAVGNVILTSDGGKTWTGIDAPESVPYKSCVAFLENDGYLAVGTSGISWSPDSGKSWTTLSKTSFHTAAYDPESRVGWMAGANGAVARFQLR